MTRVLLVLGAPVLLGVVPLLAVVMLAGGGQLTAAACPPMVPGPSLGTDSGVTGGVTAPITGRLTVAQANIPTRSGIGGFRTVMRRLLMTRPDLITLNEQSARSLGQIESVARGYTAWRDPSSPSGQRGQALDTVVAWKTSVWSTESVGRIPIVTGDRTTYGGRPVVWDRFATWALLRRRTDGAIVSIVSVHQMTNPAIYGPNRPARQRLYGQGMDNLVGLLDHLASHGPVFVGGDFNVHPTKGPGGRRNGDDPWAAPMKMSAAGYGWFDNGVDYLFYQRSRGISLAGHWDGPTAEPDHRWIAARFDLNDAGASAGAGATAAAAPPAGSNPATTDQVVASNAPVAAGGLPQVPGFDQEQVKDAAEVVAAGKAMGVPDRALAIGLMTAYGESSLHDVGYGDAAGPDSRGVFQQRTSWGSLSDRMNPYVAATSFFKALLQIPGWQGMQPTLAAHATQRNADPNYYTPYWPKAITLLAALAGSSAVDAITASSAGSTAPSASSTGCVTPVAYASGDVGWPVPAQWVTSDAHNYGHTGSHWASFHTGTDFDVPLGTPVLAATSGVVHLESGGGWSWAGRWLVQVQTAGPGSLTTWYAHMEQLSVTDGQYVTVGQQLGLSGAEGNVTGPHLHFEVHPHGGGYMQDQVDPSTWLAQHVGKPIDNTGSGVAETTPQTTGSTS